MSKERFPFTSIGIDLHLTQITHISYAYPHTSAWWSLIFPSTPIHTVITFAYIQSKRLSWVPKALSLCGFRMRSTYNGKREKLELFTLKNRKQMCWRENKTLVFFTSSSTAHESARMPSTSWFQCRFSPLMRCLSRHSNNYKRTTIVLLEPRKFSPKNFSRFRNRRLNFQLVTVDHQANCQINSKRLLCLILFSKNIQW